MNFVKIKTYFLQKKTKVFVYSFFVLLLSFSFAMPSIRGLDAYKWNKIDASKNARLHSNMGNIFFDEKNYQAAIKEYEIAYNLTADKAQSSVYLYNIARCFMTLNQYQLAKNAILGAIKKDCMNITYYNALADCIIKLNQQDIEIEKYLKEYKNPYNRIIVGLILQKIGKKQEAKFIFDEFVNKYPDMIITDDVKMILNQI